MKQKDLYIRRLNGPRILNMLTIIGILFTLINAYYNRRDKLLPRMLTMKGITPDNAH